MKTKLLTTIKEVFTTLSANDQLSFKVCDSFSFFDEKIVTPIGDVMPLFLNHKSKLQDQFIDLSLLNKLVDVLTNNHSIIRLNHIGFCYKAAHKEKERLIKLMNNSKYYLYQEPSNDDGQWLFIGDANKWEEPTIEFVPIEKTSDQWVDYWLPHIQIDIDTVLSGKQIIDIIKSIFGKSVHPFPIVIDGTIYIVRNRLGTIDGVNIMIDLATNSRDVKRLKQNVWKQIS